MNEPTTLEFVAPLELTAAGEGKRPTFAITAYTGGVINPPGFFRPVVVDLAGLKARGDTLPILRNHDEDRILGQADRIAIGRTVELAGTITSESADANEVVIQAKNGFKWQASIGANISRREFLEAGKTATVNGRTITGPALIAREASLYETSIVAVGADGDTSATIAAKRADQMNDDEPITTITTTDAAELVARMGEHKASPELVAQAIREGWTIDKAELEALRQARPKAPQHLRAVQGSQTAELEASLLLRAGAEGLAVKAYGEQTVEIARKRRIGNLFDLCAAALTADHRTADGSRDEVIRAAFSTASLPTVLANTVGRMLLSAYMEGTSRWRVFVSIKSAASFKQQTDVRPSAIQNLEKLGGSGEIKHTDIAEEDTYNWQVDTFARMISITRKTIVDDDLGFVSTLAPSLGTAAARALNDLLWETILGGQTAGHFAVGNGNLATASSALASDTLAAGVTAMRKQRDSRDYDLDISPVALCVPPDLEYTARTLLNSSEVLGTDGPNGNPVQNIVNNLLVEPRISNTDRFSNASTTQWFLFAGPMSNAVIVGFLDGREGPVVEIQDAPFNTLGVQMRAYHDFGVALGDEKGGYKATGAS